jgi:hypothetical protein
VFVKQRYFFVCFSLALSSGTPKDRVDSFYQSTQRYQSDRRCCGLNSTTWVVGGFAILFTLVLVANGLHLVRSGKNASVDGSEKRLTEVQSSVTTVSAELPEDLADENLWGADKKFPNETENMCFEFRKDIFSSFKLLNHRVQPSDPLCESAFFLGNETFIYVCLFKNEPVVALSKSRAVKGSKLAFRMPWQEFCVMMFMFDRLAEDIRFVKYFVRS